MSVASTMGPENQVVVGNPVCPCGKTYPHKVYTTNCEHESLTVNCGHAGRKLVIQPTSFLTEFEVVAGYSKSPDQILCKTKLLKGPCEYHRDEVFDVVPRPSPGWFEPSHEDDMNKTDSSVEFSARSVDPGKDGLRYLWPSGQRYVRAYTVSVATCSGHTLNAVINAYPDIRWSAGLTLTAGRDRFNRLSITPSGFLKVTWDGGNSIDLAARIKDKWLKVSQVMGTVKEVVECMQDHVAKALAIKIEPIYPNVSLSGSWGWEEISGSPMCGYGFDVTFGLAPLIGINVAADITEAILKRAPGGSVLLKVKRKAEKGHKGKHTKAKFVGKIVVSLSGTIGGTLQFKKAVGGDSQVGGEVKGTVQLKLEGNLQIEGSLDFTLLKASASGGASFSAVCGLVGIVGAGYDGVGILANGKIEFTGLTLKAASQVSVDVTVGSPPKKKSGGFEAKAETDVIVLIQKKDLLSGKKYILK